MRSDQIRVDLRAGTQVVIVLAGEIDVATAGVVADALTVACEDEQRRDVLVDLVSVEFFDAQAVNVFVATADRLRRAGRRFALRGLSAHQRRILRVCDLGHLLQSS